MFKQDYIMRLIEQLAQAFHQIIGLKARGRFDEAEAIISRTGQLLLGCDMALLRGLSDEGIIALLKRTDAADIGAYIVAAELLREQGDMDGSRSGPDASYPCYLKSLSLYLESFTIVPEACSAEYAEKIAFLTDQLAPYVLPAHIQRKLLVYFELRGDFAQAENVLFQWAEADDPAVREHGHAFYARLRARTDDDLVRGGLPRAEMEEGFLEFTTLTAAS